MMNSSRANARFGSIAMSYVVARSFRLLLVKGDRPCTVSAEHMALLWDGQSHAARRRETDTEKSLAEANCPRLLRAKWCAPKHPVVEHARGVHTRGVPTPRGCSLRVGTCAEKGLSIQGERGNAALAIRRNNAVSLGRSIAALAHKWRLAPARRPSCFCLLGWHGKLAYACALLA